MDANSILVAAVLDTNMLDWSNSAGADETTGKILLVGVGFTEEVGEVVAIIEGVGVGATVGVAVAVGVGVAVAVGEIVGIVEVEGVGVGEGINSVNENINQSTLIGPVNTKYKLYVPEMLLILHESSR